MAHWMVGEGSPGGRGNGVLVLREVIETQGVSLPDCVVAAQLPDNQGGFLCTLNAPPTRTGRRIPCGRIGKVRPVALVAREMGISRLAA